MGFKKFGEGEDESIEKKAKFAKKKVSKKPNPSKKVEIETDPNSNFDSDAKKVARKLRFAEKEREQAEYLKLKQNRKVLEQSYIERGLINDPNKKYSLDRAIILKGECEEKCPEFEVRERIVERQIDFYEKDPSTNQVDEGRMVKRFARSSAGRHTLLPCDILTPTTIKNTVDYLIDEVLGREEEFERCQTFLRDRLRAMRNDFVPQHFFGLESVYVYERTIRFHVLSLHLLDLPTSSVFPEIEQMNNSFTSLLEDYERLGGRGVACENCCEFYLYSNLLTCKNRTQPQGSWKVDAYIGSPYFKLYRLIYQLVEKIKRVQSDFWSNQDLSWFNFTHLFQLLPLLRQGFLLAIFLEMIVPYIQVIALYQLTLALDSSGNKVTVAQVTHLLGCNDLEHTTRVLAECKLRVEAGFLVYKQGHGKKLFQAPKFELYFKRHTKLRAIDSLQADFSYSDLIHGKSVPDEEMELVLESYLELDSFGNTQFLVDLDDKSSIQELSSIQSVEGQGEEGVEEAGEEGDLEPRVVEGEVHPVQLTDKDPSPIHFFNTEVPTTATSKVRLDTEVQPTAPPTHPVAPTNLFGKFLPSSDLAAQPAVPTATTESKIPSFRSFLPPNLQPQPTPPLVLTPSSLPNPTAVAVEVVQPTTPLVPEDPSSDSISETSSELSQPVPHFVPPQTIQPKPKGRTGNFSVLLEGLDLLRKRIKELEDRLADTPSNPPQHHPLSPDPTELELQRQRTLEGQLLHELRCFGYPTHLLPNPNKPTQTKGEGSGSKLAQIWRSTFYQFQTQSQRFHLNLLFKETHRPSTKLDWKSMLQDSDLSCKPKGELGEGEVQVGKSVQVKVNFMGTDLQSKQTDGLLQRLGYRWNPLGTQEFRWSFGKTEVLLQMQVVEQPDRFSNWNCNGNGNCSLKGLSPAWRGCEGWDRDLKLQMNLTLPLFLMDLNLQSDGWYWDRQRLRLHLFLNSEGCPPNSTIGILYIPTIQKDWLSVEEIWSNLNHQNSLDSLGFQFHLCILRGTGVTVQLQNFVQRVLQDQSKHTFC